MSKQTGGSAFPTKDKRYMVGTKEAFERQDGMTLRDYFAAQVMPSLMQGMSRENFRWSAERAYEMADAMIAERNK